jgi:laccase
LCYNYSLFSFSPLHFFSLIDIFAVLTIGEWWNGDVDAVENEMMLYGGGPNISDAYTINGLPGPLYPCSNKGNKF